jgi:hypothetical protein
MLRSLRDRPSRPEGVESHDRMAAWTSVEVCCQQRQEPRVRTRVKACLQTMHLAAVPCSLGSPGMQEVSVCCGSPQLVYPDFNPKVAGSIPARPIEGKTRKDSKDRPALAQREGRRVNGGSTTRSSRPQQSESNPTFSASTRLDIKGRSRAADVRGRRITCRGRVRA